MHVQQFFSPIYPRSPFDLSARYATSWLFSSIVLALCRFLFALYAFATLLTIFVYNGTHHNNLASRQSFSFFTYLAYWGLAFYFLFSAIHTWSYWKHARRGERGYSLQRWPMALQGLHGLLYATVVTFPVVVTIVYWAILFKRQWFPVTFNAWSNLSQHALNSLFCLFEIIVPRTAPPSAVYLPCLVLLLALYLSLAYITYATQGYYVYSFLGSSPGLTAAYIFGILAGTCIIFGIVCGVIRLRMRLTEGKQQDGYSVARSRPKQEDLEMNAARVRAPLKETAERREREVLI